MNKSATITAILIAVFLIFAPVFWPPIHVLPIYGILVFSYITGKMVFAEIYRRNVGKPPARPEASADVAIAFYNEDAELLITAVRSALDQQDVRIGRVILCDDGSPSPQTFDAVSRHFSKDARVKPVRVEQNRGKRHALATCFDHIISDFVVLLDSDSVLETDAISRMIALMAPDVAAVTANIDAINAGDNLLSRLIDSRYRHAFMVERAAQSHTGSVLCASGVATVYRSAFLLAAREEWTSQTFLGQPVQFGDDRRLTGMALRGGKVIIALDAVVHTHVPTNAFKFFKQQLRWNKSFIRESILFVREFGVLSWPGFLSFTEVFFWIFYLNVIANLIIFDRVVGSISFVFIWISYVMLAGFYRNISVLLRNPRLILFVPLYSLLHVVILTPLRLLALLTIMDTRWGTR